MTWNVVNVVRLTDDSMLAIGVNVNLTCPLYTPPLALWQLG